MTSDIPYNLNQHYVIGTLVFLLFIIIIIIIIILLKKSNNNLYNDTFAQKNTEGLEYFESYKSKSNQPNELLWIFPTKIVPFIGDLEKIKQVVKQETKVDLPMRISNDSSDPGIIFGGGTIEYPHMVLDVAESAARNIIGSNKCKDKSTLYIGGQSDGYSVQPCFMLTKPLETKTVKEIERLFEFVSGVKSKGYHVENRFYIDTQSNTLDHGALDVSELLVRRMTSDCSIQVKAHSIKVLPRK